MSKKDWMSKATNPKEKGELHRKLKIPLGEKIPTAMLKKKKKELQEAAKGDRKLTKGQKELLSQIIFALNARKAEMARSLVALAEMADQTEQTAIADGLDIALDALVTAEQ